MNSDNNVSPAQVGILGHAAFTPLPFAKPVIVTQREREYQAMQAARERDSRMIIGLLQLYKELGVGRDAPKPQDVAEAYLRWEAASKGGAS